MRFTVRKKLWAGFLSVVFIMIVIGTVSFIGLKEISSKYQFLIDDRMHKVVLLEQQLNTQNQIAGNIRGYMLYKNPAYLDELTAAEETFTERLELLDSIILNEDMRNLLKEIEEASESYSVVLDNITKEVNAGNEEKALQIATNGAQYQDVITESIRNVIAYQTEAREQTEEELNRFLANTTIVIIALIIAGVVASIVIITVINRMISKPVGRMTEALVEVSQGNFAIEQVTVNNRDEVGEMAAALNQMVGDLRSVIQRSRDSAVQLAVQSEELSASAEESLAASEMVAEVSERNMRISDEQAEIVSQATASMEEMITAIDQITEDNEGMLGSSEDVARLVKEGSALIDEFTEQMTTINQTMEESSNVIRDMAEHSENIRTVTALISDIAEQTNLLALNAAIEAARAGEHGKGFAVVAEEVRNLAEQSKRSTEDIGTMIDAMITNVSKAVASTEEGHKRVGEGLEATKRTSDVFHNIENATQDVGEKVSAVSAAIEQLRAMTDEVANGAKRTQELAAQTAAEAQSTSAATEEQLAANEEITSSSQVLAELAEQLQTDMGQFKV